MNGRSDVGDILTVQAMAYIILSAMDKSRIG